MYVMIDRRSGQWSLTPEWSIGFRGGTRRDRYRATLVNELRALNILVLLFRHVDLYERAGKGEEQERKERPGPGQDIVPIDRGVS